ncbi:hypothetical protein AAFF_G00146450 [Aldrovandia affinis]|uniref:Uncharacterized protein n=1 Tax=Aldrovandia affinis TaxID=143900 RepID=A0AAD7W9T6_9TELE|nr:hypothetical protein AAFF_G00146450 [Aldrovandia affinis]
MSLWSRKEDNFRAGLATPASAQAARPPELRSAAPSSSSPLPGHFPPWPFFSGTPAHMSPRSLGVTGAGCCIAIAASVLLSQPQLQAASRAGQKGL